MNSVDYENQLLNAIETIVDNAINNAGYDKTIKAVVEKCLDSSIGKYSVRYQDSVFNAYSNNPDIKYSDGALVQILIPGNDMGQNKIIVDVVKKDQMEYNSVLDEDSQYIITSNNSVLSSQSFGLCSYKTEDSKILYDRDNDINLIDFDYTTIQSFINNVDNLVCGAKFKTNLAPEQQYRGNYGISFIIDFKDNITGATISKEFLVDINKMKGTPYDLSTPTKQYGIFEINNENYISVKKISIFSKDFANTKESGYIDDIYVSDIELSGAKKLTENEINNYSLALSTDGKNYFDGSSSADSIITLQADFRIKNQIHTDNVMYYWFKENNKINKSNPSYCLYGGDGWECLNNYNTVNSDNNTRKWVNEGNKFIVAKKDLKTSENQYKCVAVYNSSIILDQSIYIYNYNADYELSIVSDDGTVFYYDNGYPTLKVLINNQESQDSSFSYKWVVVDNNKKVTALEETTTANQEYNNAVSGYEDLIADIESGTAMPAASESTLESYLTIINNYDKIQRVEGNSIYKVDLKAITDYSIFKCSVYKNNIYLGTVSITLENRLFIEGDYYIEVENGDKTFSYNALGVSPASQSLDDSIEILPLKVRVYDNKGNAFNDEILNHCEIIWDFPIENTMLTRIVDSDNKICKYSINEKYDNEKDNNTIKVTVKYKDLILSKDINFNFVKDGEPGTNGTDIVCKIVPNSNIPFYNYPMIINGNLNYETPTLESNNWFKIQLWKSGALIFEDFKNNNSLEGLPVVLKWEVLKNKYTSSIEDPSSIEYDSQTNEFSYSGSYNNNASNIIKCQVQYDGNYYYTTLPIIIAETDTDYDIELIKNTGFRYVMYSSSGKEPQYDNTNPFTIKVYKNINSYKEDITDTPNSDYSVTYEWNIRGRKYINNNWVNTNDLTIVSDSYYTNNKNQRNIKPVDSFDGECVNNAVEVLVKRQNNTVCKIYIPIHLYLNRYGIAALNDWDGNKITLNNELGSIMAPQVGAGSKNANNQFTGVLMGKVKESNSATAEEGLFGYNNGIRTIFLDAHSGKAQFGKSGAGQIILDPTNDTAKIQSGNYVSGTSGMLIDFTTPEIKFGNGKFVVDSKGKLTASEATISGSITANTGKIAGWTISNLNLTSENSQGKITGLATSDFAGDPAIYAGGGDPWSDPDWISNTPFYVTNLGYLKATNANITGTISASTGNIAGWEINSGYLNKQVGDYLFQIRSDASATDPALLIYKWTEPIGYKFFVRPDGYLYASSADITGTITSTNGHIGGCTIDGAGIYSGSDNSTAGIGLAGQRYAFWAGSSPSSTDQAKFRVDHAGNLVATSATITGNITSGNLQATGGNIAGWQFNNEAIFNGIGIGTAGSFGMSATIADWGFWAGNGAFRVTQGGAVYCSNLAVTGGSITGGTINIGANGGYLRVGYGYTHPEVSGINITSDGNYGINMGGNGISEITGLQVKNVGSGKNVTNLRWTSRSGDLFDLSFACGLLYAVSINGVPL